MPPIINAQQISKAYGIAPLFQNISFTVSEGDRIGLIGPNGAGKSTLLQILALTTPPDSGDVAIRKRTRLAYVAQRSEFIAGQTVKSIAEEAMSRSAVPESDRQSLMAETLGRAGFSDFELRAVSLSGGWRKRLEIVEELVQAPDLLLLDEPTNHLDLAGIKWLEGVLQNGRSACVVVSHDRYILVNVTTMIVELNRVYEAGLIRVRGNYSSFLEAKESYLAAQSSRQDTLANRARTEIEWLRRGPKARGAKAKARIDTAQEMISELAELKARRRTSTADIDFSFSERRTKQLMELENVGCAIGDRTLFS